MPQIPRPIRVVVADDDASFRAAVRDALQADARFTVVGELATGTGVAELADRERADIVLLDVRMPTSGPEAASTITARREWSSGSRPRVCALSAQTGSATVVAMLQAGATGFLAKGSVGVHLPDLVARCCAGEVVLAVPTAADALRHLVPARHVPLTS